MIADTTFSPMIAMLMSEKIKTLTATIYAHLVKTMDEERLLGERYGKQHTTLRALEPRRYTVDPIVMYAHKAQRTDKPKRHAHESDQLLVDISKQLPNPNIRDPVSSKQNRYQIRRYTS